MSKTNTKGSLKDRIASDDARKASRGAAPKPPGGNRVSLPAGIETGIAKLTRVDFNVIENGPYEGSQRLYIHGVVLEPQEHDGQNCEGLLAQPGQITLDDVSSQYGNTTFAENVAKAENRLKLLGFPTQDFEDLEDDTLLYFKEAGDMYFTFRTWKPEDSDRVITMIGGPTDYVATESAEQSQVKEVESDPHYASNQTVADPPKEQASLSSVGIKADTGDENAQRTIVAKAEEAGINPEDAKYDNWVAVVDAIESSAVKEDTKTVIEVGDVWSFTNKENSQLDVEVVSIAGAKKKYCTVRDLQGGKLYEKVPVTNLVEIA